MGCPGFGPTPEMAARQEAQRKAEEAEAEKTRLKEERREAKRAVKAARRKSDPELVEYAREFRDRWQEAVEREPGRLLPSAAGGGARYEVARLGEGGVERRGGEERVLPRRREGGMALVAGLESFC